MGQAITKIVFSKISSLIYCKTLKSILSSNGSLIANSWKICRGFLLSVRVQNFMPKISCAFGFKSQKT